MEMTQYVQQIQQKMLRYQFLLHLDKIKQRNLEIINVLTRESNVATKSWKP